MYSEEFSDDEEEEKEREKEKGEKGEEEKEKSVEPQSPQPMSPLSPTSLSPPKLRTRAAPVEDSSSENEQKASRRKPKRCEG